MTPPLPEDEVEVVLDALLTIPQRDHRRTMRETAEQILTALAAHRAARGMVVVPREPTEAMLDAGEKRGAAWAIYRAMVNAASPSPPSAMGGEEGK